MLNFIKNISPVEIAAIALILIILFGSKVVIRLGRSGGETLKEMKKIRKNITDAIEGDPKPNNSKKEAA